MRLIQSFKISKLEQNEVLAPEKSMRRYLPQIIVPFADMHQMETLIPTTEVIFLRIAKQAEAYQ